VVGERNIDPLKAAGSLWQMPNYSDRSWSRRSEGQ
jgi:hypothetical protein